MHKHRDGNLHFLVIYLMTTDTIQILKFLWTKLIQGRVYRYYILIQSKNVGSSFFSKIEQTNTNFLLAEGQTNKQTNKQANKQEKSSRKEIVLVCKYRFSFQNFWDENEKKKIGIWGLVKIIDSSCNHIEVRTLSL